MNPVIKYRGGKLREIPHFKTEIPEKFDRYFEPFFGGGAVYFYLEPERAVLNDINSKLMTFYRELRDDYPRLRRELDRLQELYEANQADYKIRKSAAPEERVPNANEPLYYEMRDRFNHPDGVYLESTVYFFINKTAYSGMIRYNRDGEYNVPFGRYVNFNTKLVTDAHHELLQRAELFNTDYKEIFDMAAPGDFMFLDPPYDCVFNDYGNLELSDGFNEDEHRRLAADFRNLSCRALMVIGKTALTEELYKPYIAGEYHKSYAVNIRNRFHNEKMHIIVKNY